MISIIPNITFIYARDAMAILVKRTKRLDRLRRVIIYLVDDEPFINGIFFYFLFFFQTGGFDDLAYIIICWLL